MTKEEAISYIERYTWSTTKLGLERTQALLSAFGDPQKKLKFIHVAGSNGKGSTCAMLERILREAGYRTGLYISPYIQDFCERAQVCGEPIPGEDLARITAQIMPVADAMEDHPSQFELVTAIALEYFYEAGCEIVVLEVGMGGLLDSTNAIDAPEAAVITNIGLEHTEYLGNTLEEIAATKAGIIKPGCSCVCYDGAPEVTEVVRSRCEVLGVPFTGIDSSKAQVLSRSLDGQRFSYKGETYLLALLGPHQVHNAVLALETVGALRARGWDIPQAAVTAGLQLVQWPARFEVLRREPPFILDGGHNPQCVEALSAALTELAPGQKFTVLMGVLSDKDYEDMTAFILPHAARFLCVTPDSPRALPAEKLAAYLQGLGYPAEAYDSIEAAVSACKETPEPTVAFGSLYMAGRARTEVLKER